jgi:hypothetical protein
MTKITQEMQDHPPKISWIRRIIRQKEGVFAGSSDSIGFAKNITGEPKAIMRVLVRTILQAQRYCGYCVKRLPFLFITFYLLFASCCGYSTRSLLPDYIQKVHIKLFENATLKAGLDELATQRVIEAFRKSSGLRIVDEKLADIRIEGKVSNFSKDPYTYTSDQNIIEYKITVQFSIRCVDVMKNEVFWEGNVSDWATYAAGADEDNSIDEAIKKTADRLVATILTNW